MTRHELKTRIKDLAAEGRALRGRIQTTSGPERHALWNEKRRVGRRARAALLAYAFLRGVPHERMEPRCRPSDLLYPGVLAQRWEQELGIRVVRLICTPPPPTQPPAPAGGLLRFFTRRPPEPAPVVEMPVVDSVWTERRLIAWLKRPRASAVAG
jgi:hypothetical protein